ncbi:MAG TPA: hypothetical protein VIF63_01135 [Candidatus Limnocylindrales bacterium]
MSGGTREATGTPPSGFGPGIADAIAAEPVSADVPAAEATSPETSAAERSAVDVTRFAHASEAEMARILDFYAVRWDYEPTTFPILWNLEGEVVESFAPDFYLPDLEMFLEMTTLKQRLVRKKNRKLRRLRELYPDIRIKLFYARDFRAMLLKYGRLALAEALSGTPGQVVPERARVVVEPDAAIEVLAEVEEPEAADAPTVVIEAPIPRPRPRARPGRRRRRSSSSKVAGAEREAGA